MRPFPVGEALHCPETAQILLSAAVSADSRCAT